MGLGADLFETVDIRRPKGEESHFIKGNYTFDKIRDSLKEHFTYLKNPDDITVKEASDFVKFFKEKTGTKNLDEIEIWLRQKGIDNT